MTQGTIESVAWALFIVWVGAAFIADVSWGVGFLGVGVITLAAQAARRYSGLRLDGFWLVIGVGWLVWGVLELVLQGGEGAAPRGAPQWGPGMHWPALWWVFPLVFFLFIATIMRSVMGGGRHRTTTESAMEILNRRYASGEIGKAEYEEKMSAVMRPPRAA